MRALGLLLAALLTLASAPSSQAIGPVTAGGPRLYVAPPSGGGGTVVADLQVSRTSCIAPCGVQFDATGSTSSDATVDEFRQLAYSFNAGDPGSGTYAETGQSKNTQKGGPVWGHVYEQPGTYTAKVRVRDSSGGANDGDNDQDEVTITVADPNTYFSGTSTICLDPAGGTGWGPTGCSYVTSIATDFATDNRRILIRAGSTYNSQIRLDRLVNNVHIMAYGAGAAPILTQDIQIPKDATNTSTSVGVWPEDIVVQGLDLRAGISLEQAGGRHILIKDNLFLADLNNVDTWIDSGHALSYETTGAGAPPPSGWTVADYHHVRNLFLVGNQMIGDGVNNASFFGDAVESVFLDNEIYWVESGAHNIRITQGHKTFVGHNNLRGRSGDGSTHAIKIHSSGYNALNPASLNGAGEATRYVVIADNLIGSSTNNDQWLVSIRPQSDRPDPPGPYMEGIEDVLIERNVFNPAGASVEVMSLSRRLTMRANSRTDAGSVRTMFITDAVASGYHSSLTDWDGPYYNMGELTYLDPS